MPPVFSRFVTDLGRDVAGDGVARRRCVKRSIRTGVGDDAVKGLLKGLFK